MCPKRVSSEKRGSHRPPSRHRGLLRLAVAKTQNPDVPKSPRLIDLERRLSLCTVQFMLEYMFYTEVLCLHVLCQKPPPPLARRRNCNCEQTNHTSCCADTIAFLRCHRAMKQSTLQARSAEVAIVSRLSKRSWPLTTQSSPPFRHRQMLHSSRQ